MDDNPLINITNKICDSSLITYLQVPFSPKKILPKIGDHFVTPGKIQMGDGYKKNSKFVEHVRTFATH